jgi:hypothetical protein
MGGEQLLTWLDVFTKIVTVYLGAVGTYFTIRSLWTRHHPQFYFSGPNEVAPGTYWDEFAAIKENQRYHTYDDLNLLVRGQNPEEAFIRIWRDVKLNGVKVRRYAEGQRAFEKSPRKHSVKGWGILEGIAIADVERRQSESLKVEASDPGGPDKQYLIRMKLDFTDKTLVFVSVENRSESPIAVSFWGKVTEHNF